MTSPLQPHAHPDAFAIDAQAETSDAEWVVARGLAYLCDGLPRVAPANELRTRLLTSARRPGRLVRFADQVAKHLDVTLAKAQELLERIDDATAWTHQLPDVSFLWVEGGPSVAAAVRGFTRVTAGCEFPEHEHLGDELVLVLQGGFEDAARGLCFRAGDVDRMPAGSTHTFRALPGGTDLLKLSIVQVGVRALGQVFEPR